MNWAIWFRKLVWLVVWGALGSAVTILISAAQSLELPPAYTWVTAVVIIVLVQVQNLIKHYGQPKP